MNQPIIELHNVTRSFNAGEETVQILKSINLTINRGEMVAIIGASGSGKSTLMNILGCLDHLTTGEYRFNGELINNYSQDELAKLRRENFGFIFQRYHLLNTLNAEGNVEVPAVYAGYTPQERRKRSDALLSALGLNERVKYYPTQLSGGQQQRVSIARALMNGGELILADEPTGALDSESGQAVLEILQDLHKAGHTIVLVTHDKNVASHAERIIELKDGVVISDTKNKPLNQPEDKPQKNVMPSLTNIKRHPFIASMDQVINAFTMALISMSKQRMRTFLTMLGIIIGIASVVLMIALGRGTMDKIINDLNTLGTSTLTIYPGTGFGDSRAGRIRSLKPSDVDFLKEQFFIESVTPVISTSALAKYNNTSVNTSVTGVGVDYFEASGYSVKDGIFFDKKSEDALALEAVLDEDTAKELLPDNENPIGEVIILNDLPVRIIGIASSKSQGLSGGRSTLNVFIPYSTAMNRLLGQSFLRNITVKVKDNIDLKLAEKSIKDIMIQLHGREDFFIFSADTLKEMLEETTFVMRALITSIAIISLVVGGIGVMNIMLVSVTERTKEIGMRMAVGARKSDISKQFLIEAILVCLLGGILGLLLAFSIGFVINQLSDTFKIGFSIESILISFGASIGIGLLFGYFPAKRAAELAPIEALERS